MTELLQNFQKQYDELKSLCEKDPKYKISKDGIDKITSLSDVIDKSVTENSKLR
jgi:hypothetical protein